ncbi:hypothetical protein BDN72DRAFT_880869 [Pluteus cervinus]|uniref:Uncharacterized protein n=1 Tax=Pluteus cervinus TaxID=181527 RepID=A0ACD3AJ49_9AGAR|nr:hypothetical protein BDN72DRAFT_880869 [Pluteus cervinus]
MSSPLSSTSSADDTLAHERTSNGKRKQDSPVLDEPTKKRTKITSTSSFTRHPVFWAEDGSVFLQFGAKRMKLYRDRLALHSEWFQELFDKKGVVLSGEVEWSIPWADVNGIDLFELDGTGVALEDFEAVLTTMENAINFCYAKPSFAFMVSLARAASFFRFGKILEFAVTYLEQVFPEELGEVTEDHIPVTQATEAILLGRNCDLPQLLKRAFYELARAPEIETCPVPEVDHVNMLDREDLTLLINLQKRLMTAWLKILTFYKPSDSCPQSTACTDTTDHCTPFLDSPTVQNYRFDPILGLDQLKDSIDWKACLCSACVKGRLDWLDQQKVTLWEDIGSWLNLGVDDTSSNSSDAGAGCNADT